MHDRVADVLAQRESLDSGAAAVGILVSFAFHAGAGAFAIWSAMHQPPPQQTSIVSIKLASPTQAIPPMTTPVTKAPPKREPRIEPPKPEPPKPIVPAPVTATAPPPPKNAVPTSAFGRSTKPGADNIPAPAPAPATPAATSTAPVVPIGGSGVTGIEGGDFPYTIYIERMQTLIGQHWFRPSVTGEVETTVYFRIERDGTIRDAKTEVLSKNAAFDRAALRAVLEASPLPPLPFAFNGNYLGVHLKFR